MILRALVLVVFAASCGVSCNKGSGTERIDPDECRPGAAAACERACRQGGDEACDRLTLMYLQGTGVARSDEKAAALERELCEGGRTGFCTGWAMALSEGRGVPKDRARARALFEQHCGADPKGCGEFGNLYVIGLGVERDLELGTFLLREGCRFEDVQSCAELEIVRSGGELRSRLAR